MLNTHTAGTSILALSLAALALTGTASASTRVPGTYTYYSAAKDPITDVNTGFAFIDELYDEGGETSMVFKCASGGQPGLWSYLISKNMLVSQADADANSFPAVAMRLGSDTPLNVPGSSQYTVTDASDNLNTTRLGFSAPVTRAMISGLLANKKLIVRITRTTGGAPLTYTFPAAGFATAWKGIKQCQ